MKIAILSDCRVPTRPTGSHGLGRTAIDMARSLEQRQHAVTLFAGPGSEWGGALQIDADENTRAESLARAGLHEFDALIDYSHHKRLSKLAPDAPVLNAIGDSETPYRPPNAAVMTRHDRRNHPTARWFPLGTSIDHIPFFEQPAPDAYLAFAAKIHPNKGVGEVLHVHRAQPVPVRFAGPLLMEIELENHVGELRGAELYKHLGGARGAFHIMQQGGGLGLMPLEALATGTPLLSLLTPGCGAYEAIRHCETGFICADSAELADAVQDLPLISRRACREYVGDVHNLRAMGAALESLLFDLVEGERW